MSPYLIINDAVFIISFGCIYFIWTHLFHWGASILFGCTYFISVYLFQWGEINFIWVHPFHLGVSISCGCIDFICVYVFHLVCIFYCDCFNLFCNMWVCVCVGFVMCGCFGNTCPCIYCVLYCLYCVFCIVSFMNIYSYLFCLY